jgi:hypothetical protein
MASSGKKKTTMGKLNRERKLRERRLDKQTKKDARRQASQHDAQSRDVLTGGDDQSIPSARPQPPSTPPFTSSPTSDSGSRARTEIR